MGNRDYQGEEWERAGTKGPSAQRSAGGEVRATGASERETVSEGVEDLADLAEKGLKKGDFTHKLLVFPVRFFDEFR